MIKIFKLYILACLLALSCASAATWTTDQSFNISDGESDLKIITFPYAGTLNIAFSLDAPYPTIGAAFYPVSGTGGVYRSPAASPFSFSNVQVFAQAYNMELFSANGGGRVNVHYSLSYTLNNPPVINGINSAPSSPVYGDTVTVYVSASDADNNLSYVRFVNGSVSVNDTTLPYSNAYIGLSAGTYAVSAYAVDTQAESDDAFTGFTIAPRPITVGAIDGISEVGKVPSAQGLQLTSGSMAYGDTLSSVGLSVSRVINASTPVGIYTISVIGSPENYSVTRTSATWIVTALSQTGLIDTDSDGVDDRLEIILFGNLTSCSSNLFFGENTDQDLYSRGVEMLGGVSQGAYTSGNWTTQNASGNSLSGTLILVTSDGLCLSLERPSLIVESAY